MRAVNLARRPFVNTRPVLRASILLWLLGAALLIVNAWLYLDFWQGSAEIRSQLTSVNAEIRQEQDRLSDLGDQLGKLQLIEQNVQVEFLNRLIAYRTFPWSSLFDQLVDVLPADVRLVTVQPEVRLGSEDLARARARKRRAAILQRRLNQRNAQPGSSSDRRQDEEPKRGRKEQQMSSTDEVDLRLNGVAKSDEALFQFVDALFESPDFDQPVLERENRDPNNGLLVFSLGVVYLTGGEDPPRQDEAFAAEEGDEELVASGGNERATRDRPQAEEDEEEDADDEEQRADVATGQLLNPSQPETLPGTVAPRGPSPGVSSLPRSSGRSDRSGSIVTDRASSAPTSRYIPPSSQAPRTRESRPQRPSTAQPRSLQGGDQDRRPAAPLPLKPAASATPRLRNSALWSPSLTPSWIVTRQTQEVSS